MSKAWDKMEDQYADKQSREREAREQLRKAEDEKQQKYGAILSRDYSKGSNHK